MEVPWAALRITTRSRQYPNREMSKSEESRRTAYGHARRGDRLWFSAAGPCSLPGTVSPSMMRSSESFEVLMLDGVDVAAANALELIERPLFDAKPLDPA